MNPSLAVKQYSRSSADQEVPLPHELRPVKVLRMTMMYLMAKIMNLCDTVDVNFAEWYHFLWDRTRGIRKDITQQELCSEEAVELVEQCARFHIHCSARLVGEDPSVFDQKINTENLTKCLQTLKYMYHDLELKGIHCKNEAEFRAYIILLNLNDGNFMWELQQLRREVQKSNEVHFALQVYAALDKNNYVRFFKLVHSTTYLNACILLRYFVQVRLCALKTILKCFSPRQPHKSYPLNELTEILAFESVEATMDFLEYHGLALTEDRTQVILDRRLFGMPEYPYAIDRAINVIESKRTCSVGEIVSGGRLIVSLYENHVPQNSFDATGRLKFTEIFTELNISFDEEINDTKRSDNSPIFEENQTTIIPSTTEKLPTISNENLFKPIIQTTTFQEFKFVVPEEKPPEKPIFVFQPMPITTSKKIVEQPPQSPPPKPILPTKPNFTEILKQKLAEEQRAAEELKKKQLQLEQQKREIENKRLIEIKEAVNDAVNYILNCVEADVKHDKLKELALQIRYRKAHKYLKIWRETVCRRKKKRRAVDYCFAWLMPRTVKEEASELWTESQSLVLSDMKRYKSGMAMEITIPPLPTVKKINLHETCYNFLLGALSKMDVRFPKELFFKVTIVLSNLKQKQIVEKILNDCIGWKNNFVLEQKKTVNQQITYCLEKNDCKTNSNAFVFISDDLNNSLLRSTSQITTPCAFLLQNQPNSSKMQLFEEQTNLVNYKFLNGKFTCAKLPELVEEALKFLAQHLDKPPPLELDTLQSFLTSHLAGDIWKRIAGLAKWNSSYRDCLKNPEVAIKIYNDNLDKLNEIIFDDERKEYADFPEIFAEHLLSTLPEYLPCDYKYFPKFWKSNHYERVLKNTLATFYLSDYVDLWPPVNQTVLECDVLTYCKKNFKNPERIFYKVMSIILRQTSFKSVLWTDLMELFALEKIAETDFAFSDSQSIFNQLFVIYNADILNKFNVSSWFYVNYPPIHAKIKNLMFVKNQSEQKETKKRESNERFSLELDIDLDEMLDKVTKKFVDNRERDLKMRKDVEEIKVLMSDLKESVEIQKKINATFEKFAMENL